MKKKPATPKGKGKTGLTIQGAELVFVPGQPENREGYEVIDEKAGNYFYNTKTGQPEPISKASEPFPTEATSDGQTNSGQAEKNVGTDSTERIATQSADIDRTDESFPTEATSKQTGKKEARARQIAGSATKASETPLATAEDQTEFAGDVGFLVADSLDNYQNGVPTRVETQADATRRWRNEGIGERVAAFRDRARSEYIAANPGCRRRDAHEHAWARAMAQFPPPGVEPVEEPEPDFQQLEISQPSIAVTAAPVADDGSVSGLADLPPGWPELPANAQLQVEIAWVTANRLRVRSGTGVDLSRALSPAPSYSALSWLETSILYPAKFADISVKATADQDSEKEFVKREKMAIAEIRSILAEMLEAKD